MIGCFKAGLLSCKYALIFLAASQPFITGILKSIKIKWYVVPYYSKRFLTISKPSWPLKA